MKITASRSSFVDEFRRYGRDGDFTPDALYAMFDWFEEYDSQNATETELDVIAICVDFTEYANLEEFRNDYGDYEMNEIEDRTTVIYVTEIRDGSEPFVIQNF